MMTYVELMVGMNDKADLFHIYCKVKTRSKKKIKSYSQIILCTCMGMMAMVRWTLGSEWVLDITIYMMNVVAMVSVTPQVFNRVH
jgi:hypothetical protein